MPMHPPLHKDERAFVFVFSPPSLCVHLSCSSLLVPVGSLSSCGDLKTLASHDKRKHRPHRTGQRALAREINLSSSKPRVFYIPSHSLVRDPRGPAQVTPTRETSRHRMFLRPFELSVLLELAIEWLSDMRVMRDPYVVEGACT